MACKPSPDEKVNCPLSCDLCVHLISGNYWFCDELGQSLSHREKIDGWVVETFYWIRQGKMHACVPRVFALIHKLLEIKFDSLIDTGSMWKLLFFSISLLRIQFRRLKYTVNRRDWLFSDKALKKYFILS